MPLSKNPNEFVLLHNPGCSKSRETKELLEARGVAFRERRYLEEPLDADEVRAVVARLGLTPRDWIRSGERAFGELELSLDADEDTLVRAVAATPVLLQRPILLHGARAAIGRPPENVLRLLED